MWNGSAVLSAKPSRKFQLWINFETPLIQTPNWPDGSVIWKIDYYKYFLKIFPLNPLLPSKPFKNGLIWLDSGDK